SGSTGKPKGVMVEHASVVNLAYYQKKQFQIKGDDRVLQFSSLCFDASVEQLFITLLSGAALVLAFEETLMDNREFDQFTARQGLTHIHAVPSYLLNMGLKSAYSLRRIVSGGDICPPELARIWSSRCEFYNEYGPTETTVTSIEMEVKGEPGDISTLPVGTPIGNTTLYLLDKNMKPVPKGVAGELYIGGDGITRGYLNRPELTRERFIPNPFIQPAQQSTGKLYKTGDLCRRRSDGNIDFLGRIDHQVKVRGYRIELGEIENRLLKHGAVKEAVVTVREDRNDDKILCAYIVPTENSERESLIGALKEHLDKGLPGYMVPPHFVTMEKLPVGGSGKINRKALPQPAFTGTNITYVQPRNEVEKKLLEIWSQLLKIESNHIGIDDSFFHLGGHSLKATQLISKMHEALNVTVPLQELFAKPTIRTLAAYLETAVHDKFLSIEAVEKKKYYALSSAQKRMFLLQQIERDGTGYNMPLAVQLQGTLDRERLENTFRKLIDRHESFRTSFEMRDGEAVQVIHNGDEVAFRFQYFDEAVAGNSEEEIRDDFVRPFDLSWAPLMRAALIKIENTDDTIPTHILMLDMHHIISDGVSFEIFTRDFMTIFKREQLPPLNIQYKEFSEWRNRLLKSPEIKKQQTWWLQTFEKEIEDLELPYDYTRPPVQRFTGSRIFSEIGVEKTAALKEMAIREDVTLFMVLMALCNVLFSRLANREDVVVGVPVAGRNHADLEPIIGMFVNTLPLRNYPEGGKTFDTFLKEVGQQALLAFENQDFPFEELIEQLQLERNLSRNPLFDVMFTLNNFNIPRVDVPGLSLSPFEMENKVSKFDLTLRATEEGEKIQVEYEYCTALFSEETIRRFDAIFRRIMDSVLETPDTSLQQIDIIPAEEKKRILVEFNDTKTDYTSHKTIHRLFEEQVTKTPFHTAIIGQVHDDGEKQTLTYRELENKANGLAGLLIKKGIRGEDIVAILMERSIEMMIGIIGILKAGGAYLPIIPDTPVERVTFMLKDSGAKILLAGGNTRAKIKEIKTGAEILFTEQFPYAEDSGNSQPPVPRHDSNLTSNLASNLAYIIYTSGSTGLPKGVLIEHHSLVNRLQWMQKRYPIGPDDVILQKTVFTFDVSVWELFWWGIEGATQCLLGPGEEKDPGAIVETIEKRNVTVMHFVPSMLSTFLEYIETSGCSDKLGGLKQVFASGEALGVNQVERFNRLLNKTNGTQLANLYGPTEATIDVSYFDCSTGKTHDKIPIGKPVDNTFLYIVDRTLKTQFIGGIGELCIAGVQLARGYLNNLELTAEKFIKNPFKPGTYLYRTGDLARWLPDGNIEYLGRIDHQVKIRGFRIELGEIENRLLKHEEVKEAVVSPIEDETGDKTLCAYIVPGETAHLETITGELKEQLGRELPGYMVPAHFVTMESIPVTTSGKVNRKSLPRPVITGTVTYTAPRDKVEIKLAEIWAQVLGIEKEKAGIDDNFFEMGGHSLKATTLVYRLYQRYQFNIRLEDVFTHPTLRQLAQLVKQQGLSEYIPIEPAETKSHYQLSSAQKRMFLIQQLQGTSIGYNISVSILLEGSPDRERMENTFRKLIDRHESFRTSFEMRGGEAVQVIHDTDGIEFYIKNYEVMRDGIADTILAKFIRPFDLSRAPLIRVGLIRKERSAAAHPSHILVLDMHHIISDGISIEILVREFMELYAGKEMQPLPLQYKDYSQWQRLKRERERKKEQGKYWLKQFEGEIPVLNLPTDYPRPANQSFEGKTLNFRIDKGETAALKTIALEQGATIFMVLLTIFNRFLSKLSGQEDIVIGTPVAGRRSAELEGIIGMFVNTLGIRNTMSGDKTFRELLDKIKKSTLGAFENQEYPFEELVEELEIKRDASRNSLFDAMFLMQNMEIAQIEIPGLKLTSYPYENNVSKFDLTLQAIESGEELSLNFEYSSKLFKETT
ncbi:MAG: amino acid adenylation domain-containing protein, partial [bacterium]|nr:amino acid adenylation domain-containing protein [bacterium]